MDSYASYLKFCERIGTTPLTENRWRILAGDFVPMTGIFPSPKKEKFTKLEWKPKSKERCGTPIIHQSKNAAAVKPEFPETYAMQSGK